MKKLFSLPVLSRLAIAAMVAMVTMVTMVTTGMMGTMPALARAGESPQTAPEKASALQVTYYYLPG